MPLTSTQAIQKIFDTTSFGNVAKLFVANAVMSHADGIIKNRWSFDDEAGNLYSPKMSMKVAREMRAKIVAAHKNDSFMADIIDNSPFGDIASIFVLDALNFRVNIYTNPAFLEVCRETNHWFASASYQGVMTEIIAILNERREEFSLEYWAISKAKLDACLAR